VSPLCRTGGRSDKVRKLDKQIDESVDFMRRHIDCQPVVAVVLGTGMGDLVERMEQLSSLHYHEIPHWPDSTALGHSGFLFWGNLSGTPVIVLQGRWHRYEGYSFEQITLPIRVLHRLGVDQLILTNAAGGLNPQLSTGQIVVVEDHINLLGGASALGDKKRLGLGRAIYDPPMAKAAMAVARQEDFLAVPGVYAAMTGPTYETRAEYRFLRRIGADVVGMSTVPEAIVAANHDMRILALSIVTNVARPDTPNVVTAQQVIDAATHAEPNVSKIIAHLAASVRRDRNLSATSD